jgi:predicted NBD/HSP70 family sugar kinase
VSTRRILARARTAVRAGTAPLLAKLIRSGADVRVRDVARAARGGDRGLRRIFEGVGRDLGFALAGVVQVLNPDCLVIAGGIAGAWPLFVGSLRSELRARTFDAASAPLRLRRGQLGDRAGILGAAALLERRDPPATEKREAPRHHPRGAGP